MSQQIGFAAEKHARVYLSSQGLHWVISNYRCRMGEIDLIMHDGPHLVFIKVRSRVSNLYGGAVASVTYHKRQKLLRTAAMYLLEKKLYDTYPVRFDVVTLEGKQPVVNWIKNAFGVDY